MELQSKYTVKIKSRSRFRFIIGLIPRLRKYIIQNYINWIARRNGATIGKYVTMPYKLAKRANSNLTVGDHTSIQSHLIDLRIPILIGSYVIIGSGVEIITVSHNIDSPDWEHKYYGLEIENYCWLATRSFILPSCRKIGYGAVCAAGSVISRKVDSLSIMVGNLGYSLRKRKEIHADLCVESLLGNDFVSYIKAYKS
jgi:acetyltransferase-like isoleucine patch superfamily enzyme